MKKVKQIIVGAVVFLFVLSQMGIDLKSTRVARQMNVDPDTFDQAIWLLGIALILIVFESIGEAASK